MTNVYDFVCRDVDGQEVSLSRYQGIVLLIVNTSSKGGAYRKIRKLQSLQRRFSERPFRILAFPCNQFFGQEREHNEEVKDFYVIRERVSFPVFSRIRVNGSSAHPLFKWLKKRAKGTLGKPVQYNFTMFLVEPDGLTVHRYERGFSWYEMSHKIELLCGAAELKGITALECLKEESIEVEMSACDEENVVNSD